MNDDTRIVKATLAAGVLAAMGASGAKFGDAQRHPQTIRFVVDFTDQLYKALYGQTHEVSVQVSADPSQVQVD
jgi:hypothetical protein